MSKFILTSDYKPTGDQPEAIRQLTEGLDRGDRAQVLLGVTGSGKTFTMANVIAQHNRPTLILSHNKTLAAQLYEEMKGFFPQNAVEYYVSYYDYYQPEAYLPTTDTYIEKDLAINDEIDRLRLSAVSNLLSGRNDVIVVSSVSCIYGMGSPVALQENVIELKKGLILDRNALLRKLVAALYVRNDLDLQRGNFRVKGDTVDIAMAYSEVVLRITFWDDEIDAIEEMDAVTFDRLAKQLQAEEKAEGHKCHIGGISEESFDKKKRVPVPEQKPEIRAHNFDEVCLGYSADMAIMEAQRCLHCKNPQCVEHCPVSVNIPDFIARVAQGDFAGAAGVISCESALPAVCGRVCPQET